MDYVWTTRLCALSCIGMDMKEKDWTQEELVSRAQSMLEIAKQAHVEETVSARGIASGNTRLSLVFIATVFGSCWHNELERYKKVRLVKDSFLLFLFWSFLVSCGIFCSLIIVTWFVVFLPGKIDHRKEQMQHAQRKKFKRMQSIRSIMALDEDELSAGPLGKVGQSL